MTEDEVVFRHIRVQELLEEQSRRLSEHYGRHIGTRIPLKNERVRPLF